MIRIIKRNLNKKTLTEKKWNWHFAFFHFKNYKNVYINGKPLKPWHLFRNGDVIEIIEKPVGATFWIGVVGIILKVGTFVASHAAWIGAIGLTAVAGVVNTILTRPNSNSTTQAKEYSSATQPELRGASNDISNGCLPVVFGKIQQTPSYGQLPYRLVVDGASTNKYRQYFVANYNNVVYSDFKLGETPRTDYSIDYLDIVSVSGSSNFIGFDNVKAVDVNEELSHDPDEQVNQNAHYDYNEITSGKHLTLNYVLKFSNVDLNAWSDKTFRNTVRTVINGENKDFTSDVTITRDKLVKDKDDKTYTYNGSVEYWAGDEPFQEIVYTNYAPVSNTRNNSAENTNELDCLYISENLITDTLNLNTTLNLSINKYQGTVSEVVVTSPENTKEVDVIIGFSQGLFHQNNDGSRSSRSVKIEVMYKQGDGEYKALSEGTELYIRDINGDKQPLSSSNTTVNGAEVTMHSPGDMNVADQLFYRPIGFTLPEKGKYTIRVRSADYADKTNFDIGSPTCAEIQFYVDGKVLDESILPKVNQIAFEATAYKGLSGTLKKFNYIAEARIPVWDGTNWDTVKESENPAAIIRYLLTDKLDFLNLHLSLKVLLNTALYNFFHNLLLQNKFHLSRFPLVSYYS